MPRYTRLSGLFLALAAATVMAVPAAADQSPAPTSRGTDGAQPVGAELARVRAATARFHDVTVAEAAGYQQVSPCIDMPDGAAMGAHWLRPELIDDQLTPEEPEALLYVPTPDGGQRLVGVEYISTDQGQTLFGHHLHDGPVGAALHAWIWQANPAGMFADFNANLSC
jgi:hypothetical protein